MSTALSFENEDKMANAILEMIRLQSFNVKDKIQRILTKEVNEERGRQSVHASSPGGTPRTMADLRGILKDDGRSYKEMRDDYLKAKYGL